MSWEKGHTLVTTAPYGQGGKKAPCESIPWGSIAFWAFVFFILTATLVEGVISANERLFHPIALSLLHTGGFAAGEPPFFVNLRPNPVFR